MATLEISAVEYKTLRAIEGMDHVLKWSPRTQLTGNALGSGQVTLIRNAEPDALIDIARRYAGTQVMSYDAGIPIEETPTGTGSVYAAVLAESIRRYERALGVMMRQRQAAEDGPSAEV